MYDIEKKELQLSTVRDRAMLDVLKTNVTELTLLSLYVSYYLHETQDCYNTKAIYLWLFVSVQNLIHFTHV